jgi:hypothetical protein
MKIKKSDWVVVRLLVDGARLNPKDCFTSREYVNAVAYLVSKYGVVPTSDAVDLIRKERGL